MFILLVWTSCTEVVDVTLSSETPRLVVEGDIIWPKNEMATVQEIRCSLSSDFYDATTVKPVEEAQITVTNLESQEVFTFNHQNNGRYVCTNFDPQFNQQYELNIKYNGEEYRAVEQFYDVPNIEKTIQNTVVDFDGSDAYSIESYIVDPANENNYYFVRHEVNNEGLPYLSVWDDSFQNGNAIGIIYRAAFTGREDFELEVGDEININISGVSKQYADYLYILTSQAYSQGDPFASIPVQLRGNIQNITNEDNRAFGYFRLSQQVTDNYIIQ